MRLNALELTGRARTHVVDLDDPPCTLHRDAVSPFLVMRQAAREQGIDLLPVSSFREFDRQVAIWNAKHRGERPLLDRAGCALDHSCLSEQSLVETVLLWSALPGASRHHWGSEIDVIDRAALPPDVLPQLVPAEYQPGAVFGRLSEWLAANAARHGFYRPYTTDRGGVMPEPWHLSYAPVATLALEDLSLDLLRQAITDAAIEGRERVLAELPQIYSRYVAAVDPPPADISLRPRLS